MDAAASTNSAGPRHFDRTSAGVDDLGDTAAEDGLALLDEDALRAIVATQPVIEQAKGLLMGCYRIDADQAFALLRRWSSSGHVKVRDLAVGLVEAAARPGPAPFQPSDAVFEGDRGM